MRFRLGALSAARADTAWFAANLLATALATALFIGLATVRWRDFETNAFDLAFFDQVIFNTSQGRWFDTSFVDYNFAGQHLEPILLAFVPAYWLGAGAYFLTVTQAVIGSLAAIPIYLFGRRLGLHAAVATAGAAAYLSNPYLTRAMAFDFHPEVMAALPAATAAWAAVAGHRRLAVASALSVLLFKEDAVFLAGALAGLMWMRGMRREAAITSWVAGVYAFLAVFVLMPLLRGGDGSDLVQRFGYLLPEGANSAKAVLLVPWRAANVLLDPDQLWTAAVFVSGSCVLALRRPLFLMALAPGLGLALLSSHPQQRHLELHYAAELVPVAVILALLGAEALRGRLPPAVLAGAMVFPTLLAVAASDRLAAGHGQPPTAQHRTAVLTAIALIPDNEDTSVSAQSGLLPRLSQRKQAHEFPSAYDRAEWIVVDRYGFRSTQSLAAGFDKRLGEVRAAAQLVFSEDGVEVFRRRE